MYNPLLDAEVEDVALAPVSPWQAWSEKLQYQIERDFKRGIWPVAALNNLDLVDTEAAAFWRKAGTEVFNARA